MAKMNKELQDHVWKHCLPKEFKEEVKKYYRTLHEQYKDYDGLNFVNAKAKVKERVVTLQYFFGEHNLTSDAEGEEDEMLYVSRKQVQEIYSQNQKEIHRECVSSSDKDCYETVNEVLKTLFGSKCLPDEKQSAKSAHCSEPKPAEPKLKVGDIASYACSPTLKHKCTVTKVMQNEHSGKWEYNVMFEWGKPGMWIPESDLEPYTGSKNEYSERIHAESVQESRIASEESHLRNLSQSMSNCDKHFDTILKDSFSKERRLNIAASIAAGWLACHGMTTPETIAMDALAVADALIIEVKKQITPKNEQI